MTVTKDKDVKNKYEYEEKSRAFNSWTLMGIWNVWMTEWSVLILSVFILLTAYCVWLRSYKNKVND